jgi:pSer/pThr/pTyr-binding forkhead associated (FHA) protein
VSDPLIARFADACGATGPLHLRVDLAGGGALAEGSVAQPFTLVGRDDACDVTLSDPEVNLRHAWLQVLGGRVFAVDLGSHSGLVWAGGTRGPGWLDVGVPVRVGPFNLYLRAAASERPSSYPSGYNPLAADTAAKTRSAVTLEFRNGRRAKDRWLVNRLLTLIGRAPDCKIHLNAEDISPYHCGIVSTRSGLWVVDLSGRGVVVNGERMRVAPLPQGAELWVGRFLIGCVYQTPPSPPTASPSGKLGTVPPAAPAAGKSGKLATAPAPRSAGSPPAQPGDARVTITPAPLQLPASEDEVELGTPIETEGLPASHIMADAFRQKGPNPSGSLSNPIHVSGSGPKPAPPVPPNSPLAGLIDNPAAPDEWSLAPLLRQMADLHGRSVAEFQQSQALLAQLFSRVKREHLAVLHHELLRIQELSAEIASLQRDVAKQALEQAAEERAKQVAKASPDDPEGWVPPSTKTPLPEASPAPRAVSEQSSGSNIRPGDRLAALLQDRAARWQALLVLFAGM